MSRYIQPLAVLLFLALVAGTFIYSYSRCGWGMLAYEYAFIAALTGECAQQQLLQLQQMSPAP
ncbi:hypothetical protein [Pseudogemmobacter faecipullorum]|uniref:Uncharacterized protein n=1 Tax=Pseudogemmobacter faecipullorum TaxID=2755041 RepID=A0ABS8CH06_9RHOB|nr:hypothetical protein [Pseudogemmobacter faecipullorum]MCB5408659.1 hypothetical protein [Pseudogemmobacter faecipullorum]